MNAQGVWSMRKVKRCSKIKIAPKKKPLQKMHTLTKNNEQTARLAPELVH